MTTQDFAAMPEFSVAVDGPERSIVAVYCADLLSWAMGNAPEDGAWCTVMGNVNSIAVAHLADIAVIVLCEGASLDEEARARAEQQKIMVVCSRLPAFEAGLAIARKAGLYSL